MSSLCRYDLRLPASVGSRKQNIIYYLPVGYFIRWKEMLEKVFRFFFFSFLFFIGKGYKKR